MIPFNVELHRNRIEVFSTRTSGKHQYPHPPRIDLGTPKTAQSHHRWLCPKITALFVVGPQEVKLEVSPTSGPPHTFRGLLYLTDLRDCLATASRIGWAFF